MRAILLLAILGLAACDGGSSSTAKSAGDPCGATFSDELSCPGEQGTGCHLCVQFVATADAGTADAGTPLVCALPCRTSKNDCPTGQACVARDTDTQGSIALNCGDTTDLGYCR